MKKRPYLIAISLLLLLSISTAFLIRAAFISHKLSSFAEYLCGYKISFASLSLTHFVNAGISELEVRESKDNRIVFSSRRLDIESKPGSVFKGEVEKLILKEPKLQLRLGGDKKTDRSFIKKIPPVDILIVQKGEFKLSFNSSLYEITFKNIDLQVNNFSPEKGGALTFEALLDVTHPENTDIKGHGRCKGYIKLTGLMPKPIGTGFLEIYIDSGTLKATAFKNAALKFALNLEKDRITFSKATLFADTLMLQGNNNHSTIKTSTVRADIIYNLESGTLHAGQVQGEIPGLGIFQGAYETVLKGVFPWKASVEAPNIDFARLFSLFKPFFEKPGDKKWSIQGKGAIRAGVQGNMSGEKPGLSGEATLEFLKGGFSSEDGTKAGQGIEGKMILKFKLPSEDKKADAVLSSELSSGEYLWGTYYKDLTKEPAKFSTTINIFVDKNEHLHFYGPLNLFETGEYACKGHLDKDKWFFSLSAKKISGNRIASFFLYEYLNQNIPFFKGLQAAGNIDADINAEGAGETLHIKGGVRMNNASLIVEDSALLLNNINMAIPLNLSYPFRETSLKDKNEAGFINIGTFKKGIMNLTDLNIPLTVSENSIWLSEAVNIPFFKGQINILQCKADNIHLPSGRLSLTSTVKNIDISSFLQKLTGIHLPGNMEASFPMIKYQDRKWATEGKTLVNIFGGEIEISDMYAKDLFLSSRKIGGNIYFNNINLGSITDAIKIGRVTGIIKGFVKGLEIEYGQPARFAFEVDSVKKSGIDQKVSVDAIENISIIGTGSDVVGIILRSGINRFFKEYPYRQMGIRCDLENDNFHIRGKIIESGNEYLIRRGFFRGIDVINRDPENMVSFKDMQERVSRVFKRGGKVSVSPVSTN